MTLGDLGIGSVSPNWKFNFLNPHRTTPEQPQNLLVQTIQGLGVGGLGAAISADGSLTLSAGERTYLGIYRTMLSGLVGGVAAVHGYRRNKGSTGWGWTWGLAGAWFPVPALGVALVQGFGKPKHK